MPPNQFLARATIFVNWQHIFLLTALGTVLNPELLTPKDGGDMPKRKALRVNEASMFNETTLNNLAKDMQQGRFATQTRLTVSDDIVTGLRAVVYKSGLISFAVSYHFGDERPFLKLGSLNKDEPDHITIEKARELSRTVKSLADKGIDVQAGLHQRLIRELDKEGVKWRPK